MPLAESQNSRRSLAMISLTLEKEKQKKRKVETFGGEMNRKKEKGK